MTRDELENVLRDLINKHEKRAEKRKYVSLDSYAREYIEAFVPEDASIEQITATTEAFKAGALAGFETLYNAFDPLTAPGLVKGSVEYKALEKIIKSHLRRWDKDISRVAATLLVKRMNQETNASAYVAHISEALAKIIEQLIGDHDDDDTDANGDKMRDDPPEPQHNHRKPPEHG